MALVKDPSGSFYLDNTEFAVDYEENSISLVGGAGGGGDITADGGMFNANATLTGEDELTIEVPDAGESATIGITPESVTLTHNTNSTSDGSIRVTENAVELKAGENTVQINSTGVDFGGLAIADVSSIGGTSAGEIAFENTLDMNSHQIKNVTDPTESQDAATKNYVDTTFATKSEIAGFITSDSLPTNATTAVAGLVKQATAVADSSGATDTALETKFNELLAALRNAGILAQNA